MKKKMHLKNLVRSLVCLVIGLVFFTINTTAVLAISPEQRRLFQSGVNYFDHIDDQCTDEPSTANDSGNGLPAGSKVYMVGSSTTGRAKASLESELPKSGYTVTGINTDGGRALTRDTDGNAPSAIQAVINDQALVRESNAVIVAIFNGDENLDEQIPVMIEQIREFNAGAKIYWATYFTGTDVARARNAKIIDHARLQGYQVIDTANAGIVVSGDNIHPTADTLGNFVQAIVKGLRGSVVGFGSSIYVLGDSITVGMRELGSLSQKLVEAGWQPTRINAIGGKTINWGIEQAAADAATIAQSQSILIGLGTNDHSDVVSGETVKEGGKEKIKGEMQSLISAVRSANPNIKIYWTSIYITGHSEQAKNNFDTARPIINSALDELAISNNVAIIPYGTSNEAKQFTSGDGVHPKNYSGMAAYVVQQLSVVEAGGSGQTASGCKCSFGSGSLVGADNRQKAFNFFVGKGYTKEWSAGIIGNMVTESGVNPIRMQGIHSKDPKHGVDVNLLEADGGVRLVNFDAAAQQVAARDPEDSMGTVNGVGWGLVQWTPAKQIIDPSRAAGIPNETIESLEYQLDFVWRQLEGTSLDAANTSRKSAGERLKETTTVEDAAVAFGRYYERFKGSSDLSHPSYANRKKIARDIYDIYGSQAPTTGSTTGGCGTNVAGANGWDLPGEGPNPMIYYSQLPSGNDPAVTGYFGNQSYGPGKISACGCGPTSWAMIVSTLTGKTVTPAEVADWAVTNNQQQASDGSSCGGSNWWWQGIAPLSEAKWGVRARQIQIEEAADHLRQGKLIIVSVGPGSVLLSSGSSGHLLVMRAVTDDGKFLFADPSDTQDKRNASDLLRDKGSSRSPLDAATVEEGLKAMFVVEKL